MENFSVAIDGPGGAGKSTVARMIAEELGYIYIDTGAMYRAIALYCLHHAIELKEEAAVNACLNKINISIKHIGSRQHIFLSKEDVSELIRIPEVTQGSSIVAVYPEVRKKLVILQRKIAENNNIIMDGRDIGTDVLPFAAVKIYLDASVSERAWRRLSEQKQRGIITNFESVRKEIEERDYRDMNRKHSPLKKAADAILIDSSNMTLLEVKDKIIELIRLQQVKKGY